MKRLAFLLLLVACGGCSGGVRTGLLDLDLRLASPMLFGDAGEVPVFYPAAGGHPPATGDSMVQAFGPAWKNVEGEHPAYDFNP